MSVYRQSPQLPPATDMVCPDCQSRRFLLSRGKIICQNCGWKQSVKRSNKFGAKRTELNGKSYDSGFEADVAAELELRLRGKDITALDTQFKLDMPAYRRRLL